MDHPNKVSSGSIPYNMVGLGNLEKQKTKKNNNKQLCAMWLPELVGSFVVVVVVVVFSLPYAIMM